MAERWQKQRAAWVLARAGRSASARRRGERLMASARRQDRHEAGAGDSAFNEVATPNVLRRSVMREEGAANILGWLALTAVVLFWVVLLAGPGLVLARVLYLAGWTLSPRTGPLRSVPLVVVAAATGVVGALLWYRYPPQGWLAVLALGYLFAQVVIGLLRAAWLVRAYGWPAVKGSSAGSATKVARVNIAVPVDGTEVADGQSPPAQERSGVAPIEVVVDEQVAQEFPSGTQVVTIDEPSVDDDVEGAQR